MSKISSSSSISISAVKVEKVIIAIRASFDQNVIITPIINDKSVAYTFVNITSNLKCEEHDFKIKEILKLEELDVKFYTKTATSNFNNYIAKKQATNSSTKPIDETVTVFKTLPVEETKPVEVTKPVEKTKPVEETKPTEVTKPTEETVKPKQMKYKSLSSISIRTDRIGDFSNAIKIKFESEKDVSIDSSVNKNDGKYSYLNIKSNLANEIHDRNIISVFNDLKMDESKYINTAVKNHADMAKKYVVTKMMACV